MKYVRLIISKEDMYVRITLSNSISVVPSGCVNDAGETKVTPHENLEGEKKIAV